MLYVQRQKLDTIDDLRVALANAIKLEFSTIPPYLTALYTIKQGTNNEIASLIRGIAAIITLFRDPAGLPTNLGLVAIGIRQLDLSCALFRSFLKNGIPATIRDMRSSLPCAPCTISNRSFRLSFSAVSAPRILEPCGSPAKPVSTNRLK